VAWPFIISPGCALNEIGCAAVACMDRRLLIIAIPLKSFPAGGFLRSYNVLTNALDILGQSGIEVELYVPISDLVEFLLSLKRSPSVDLGDAIMRIEQELIIFISTATCLNSYSLN